MTDWGEATVETAGVSADDVVALTCGHGMVELARGVFRVAGPDAAAYLQGQLSQDITALEVGESALSFLLEPQGRVVALGRVARIGENEFLFDVDPEVAEATMARLTRFRLRAKLSIEQIDYRVVALRGEASGAKPQSLEGALVIASAWPQLPGWDLLFPSGKGHVIEAGAARQCSPAAYEAARIGVGVPTARDFDERVIPAETGLLEAAVSFTKGCYAGQELVGRMDARGNNSPRRLRVVRGTGQPPAEGTQVQMGEDKRVGVLTSVAPDVVGDGGWVGLGLLARAAGTAQGLVVNGRPVLLDARQE